MTPDDQAAVLADSVDLRNPNWRGDLQRDLLRALLGVRIDRLPNDHPAALAAVLLPGDRDHTPCAHNASTPAAGGDLAALRVLEQQWRRRADDTYLDPDQARAFDMAADELAEVLAAAPASEAATEGGQQDVQPCVWWSPSKGDVIRQQWDQHLGTWRLCAMGSGRGAYYGFLRLPEDAIRLAATPREQGAAEAGPS